MTIERRQDEDSAASATRRWTAAATAAPAARLASLRSGSLAIPSVLLVVILLLGGTWLSRHFVAGEPVAQSIAPLGGATNVPPTSDVRIGFDRPIQSEGGDLDIRLSTSKGEQITGTITLDDSRTAATFTPSRAIPPGGVQVDVKLGDRESKRWSFTVPDSRLPPTRAGGPLLLVTAKANPFSSYYGEILRTEGFTSFTTADADAVTPDLLASHEVAIVAAPTLGPDGLAAMRSWLARGGKVILMRPSAELAALAGLVPTGAHLSDGYLTIDTAAAPGNGLVAEAIQFHGSADLTVASPGTRTLATLGLDAHNSARAPAVAIRSEGGGEVAAFAFDLARSVALTRQGNPDWAGQDRDGKPPIRPNDLFYGKSRSDPQPDYLDLAKVAIPQADEQMRLLTNLMLHMTRNAAPLPRFWYFPKGFKAVLILAADDHGTNSGTRRFFEMMNAVSPQNCDVSKWQCARGTSWAYPSVGLTNDEAAAFYAQGFDIGAHVTTNCLDWTQASLEAAFAEEIPAFRARFPSLPPQQGSRLHCIAWSEILTQAKIERRWGIRFDMNYYYWPPDWADGRSGFMTGSGLPMHFSDLKGEVIDVYQQETHLVDEVFSSHPDAVAGLIDRALGPEGYYGAFGTHSDFHDDFDLRLIDLAVERHVPMVSAQQMLDWMEGRRLSTVTNRRWSGTELSFDVFADPRAGRMLELMLPSTSAGSSVLEVKADGKPVLFRRETIKGIDYVVVRVGTGAYTVRYGD